MPYTFHLPDIGEGLEEAEIIVWLVGPGDIVNRDQPLVEVLTDKASSELPSPVAGTVLRLGAGEGDRLRVGDVLIELDSDSADNTAIPVGNTLPPEVVVDDSDHSSPIEKLESTELTSETSTTVTSTSLQVKAAPATRKLARQLDVDLAAVTGSGPGGRITHDDVRAAAQPTGSSSASEGKHSSTVDSLPLSAAPVANNPDLGQMTPGRHPLRGIRGVVARNMTQSWSEIPHIHTLDEVDATLLMDLRSRIRTMDLPGARSGRHHLVRW